MYQEDLVSIIIPAYNVEPTIVETLTSVINQHYKELEIIVVDDGSTDTTLMTIGNFANNHTQIHVFSKENEGLPATRNYGFQYARGEYLLFLDADDLLDVNYVGRCVEKFKEDPSLNIVYTQTQFFGRENGVFHLPAFSTESILLHNCFTATAMMRSQAFADIGQYDVNLKFAEDWEMWIRMVQKYGNVYKIDQPLFFYRKRESNDSMTDLNRDDNVSDKSLLYIYNKHYEIYRRRGYGIENLFDKTSAGMRYKKKYYSVWYRKIFYLLKGKKAI